MAGPVGEWYKDSNSIEGVLLDIYGVLYDDTGEGPVAIQGSVEAINKLKASGVQVRFCSNTSNHTQTELANILLSLGFDVSTQQIFTPAPMVARFLKEKGLRPFLLVDDGILPEFKGIDRENPDCVVLGDAGQKFTYDNMNTAFRVLQQATEPVLLAMGGGKYFKQAGDLVLDVAPFAKALEYACDVNMEVIGKPTRAYFMAAVKDMGVHHSKCLMIGDDIVSDVGGAQKCGIQAIQVRTGKYRASSDEPHPQVRPDGYVDNLLQAIDLFLHHRS